MPQRLQPSSLKGWGVSLLCFYLFISCVCACPCLYMNASICTCHDTCVDSVSPSILFSRQSLFCFCHTECSRLAVQWPSSWFSCLCLPYSCRNAVITDAGYHNPSFCVGTEDPKGMWGLWKHFHLLSHGPGQHNLGDIFFLSKLEKSFFLQVLNHILYLEEFWIQFPVKLLLKAVHLANAHLLYLCQVKKLNSTVEFQICVLPYNFNKCLKMDHWGERRSFKVHHNLALPTQCILHEMTPIFLITLMVCYYNIAATLNQKYYQC